MSYRRRRRRVRRRRAAAATALLAVAGVVVWLMTGTSSGTHRVAVVVVEKPRARATQHIHVTRVTSASSTAGTGSVGLSSSRNPSHAATTAALFRPGSAGSFARLAATLPGHVEIAVTPLFGGPVAMLGGNHPTHGWSTTKILVLVGLMRARGSRGLTPTEQSLASAAVTESDNASILSLFGELEQIEGGLVAASDYLDEVLRAAGDTETIVAIAPPPPGAVTTFGQTLWTPSNAARFFGALGHGCLLSPSESNYVLGLMQRIVPSESWGLGSAGFPVHVGFKGGWGPEPSGSYLVRQSGIVDVGSSSGAAVALVATARSGQSMSFSGGVTALTEAAQWLRQHLVLRARPARSCPVP